MTTRSFIGLTAFLIIFLAACWGLAEFRQNGTDGPSGNSLPVVTDDMTDAHEGTLHGVPSTWSWARHPVYYPAHTVPKPAITGWGLLYEAAEGNPSTNTRVQITDFKTYVLKKSDRRWHLIQNPMRVLGAMYPENFYSDYDNVEADIREESPGISATAGNGRAFHFYTVKAALEANDVAGIFVTFRARLVLNSASGPDDREQARYLACAGGDYYQGVNETWSANNPPALVGYGRFKYVKNEWQSFNMCTLKELDPAKNRSGKDTAADAAALRYMNKYPPPLD